MNRERMKKLIEVAARRRPADLVIRNCKVVDVYGGGILEGDIAIADGHIAGIGDYEGVETYDAGGRYASPGFTDSHIHIESSYVSPEEIGRLLVPHGATTIIADPHEIVNVLGLPGLDYMLQAARNTALDIKFMIPSCVPATPFEHAGARIDAEAMAQRIGDPRVLGLGEFMNFPGVIQAQDDILDKLMVGHGAGKLVDGHSPALVGADLNAYVAAGIHTDHECSTIQELRDRVSRGLYVLLREGSACHNIRDLLAAVTPANARRCLLCSDDRQPKTIFEKGHLEDHLRICVELGVAPVEALRMASLNAAECFRLHDRGAIAPGLRADVVLLDDLEAFHVQAVFIAGKLAAEGGTYVLPTERHDSSATRGSFHVKDFSMDRLRLPLASSRVHVIDIQPGGVGDGQGHRGNLPRRRRRVRARSRHPRGEAGRHRAAPGHRQRRPRPPAGLRGSREAPWPSPSPMTPTTSSWQATTTGTWPLAVATLIGQGRRDRARRRGPDPRDDAHAHRGPDERPERGVGRRGGWPASTRRPTRPCR